MVFLLTFARNLPHSKPEVLVLNAKLEQKPAIRSVANVDLHYFPGVLHSLIGHFAESFTR
jgi:hypothetical protein